MTASSSSTKVPVLPPILVMSMKPKKTHNSNSNHTHSASSSSANIDENYDNGFIDLKNNNNISNQSSVELETLRKKVLKTTANNSNSKLTTHKNSSFRANNSTSQTAYSSAETQLLNKLKSLNICTNNTNTNNTSTNNSISQNNETNHIHNLSSSACSSSSYKYEDIIKRKFELKTAPHSALVTHNSASSLLNNNNNKSAQLEDAAARLSDLEVLIEKKPNSSNLIYLIRSKTSNSISNFASNFNLGTKDQVVLKSTESSSLDFQPQFIIQYKTLERKMTLHHEKIKDLLASSSDETAESSQRLVELASNSSSSSTTCSSSNNTTTPSTSATTASNSNTSTKPAAFDPYLKYEYISSAEPGDFGRISLVLSRSNPNNKYVMKIIDLPEFKTVNDTVSTPRSSTSTSSSSSRYHSRNQHHHHQALYTPEQIEFNNLIELNRLKTIEYERLVKFLKELLQHSIKNSSLIKLIDTFTTRDLKSAYIVMEHCKDDSLAIRISQHRTRKTFLANDLIIKWFSESCDALNYLHEHGILHSNLKPTNFLLDLNENIKLADFGYLYLHNTVLVNKAKSNQYNQSDEYTNFLEQNRVFYFSRLINGTNEAYLPKETIQQFEYSSLSEVYCLAAVFFELIFIDKKYKWSEESLKSELKLKCKDENFAYLLSAMLSNQACFRPNSAMISSFTEWQRCLDVEKTLSKTIFSTTMLSVWKSQNLITSQIDLNEPPSQSQLKSKKVMLKQIKLSATNRNEIGSLLPKLSGHLMHSNILSVSRFILVDCRLLVLHDFMPNGSLRDKIDKQIGSDQAQPFKEDIITQWLIQIANGLEYLHSKSILNGNLKCENILFNKANLIKLVDFGFYHMLTDNELVYNYASNYTAPEVLASKSGLVSTKSDIFMFGACLYKCMTLKDYNHKEVAYLVKSIDLKQHIFNSDYSKTMKQIVLDMLHDDPTCRPTLKIILNELKILVNVNCSKFVTSVPQCTLITSKIKTFFCRDFDDKLNDLVAVAINQSNLPKMFFASKRIDELNRKPTSQVTNQYVEKFRANQYDELYSTFRISLLKNESRLGRTKINETNESDSAPQPNDLLQPNQPDFTIKVEAIECLPQLSCMIENNYILGSDADYFYLIDDHLKYVKNVLLIDALETVKTNGTNSSSRSKRTNFNDLINLKLRVKAVCYDSPNKKVYQLVTIQNQHCILNIFELEFRVKSPTSSSKTSSPGDAFEFNLFLTGKFHLSTVGAEGSKVILCTDAYLYILEREKSIRAFCKENSQYVHTLRNMQQIQNQSAQQQQQQQQNQLPTVSYQQYSLPSSQQMPPPPPPQQNDNKLQDFCVDFHGNMYVAYSYSIEAYNPKGEFIWTYDFNNGSALKAKNPVKSLLVKEKTDLTDNSTSGGASKSNANTNNCTIQGKITRIAVSKNGVLALITQDDKDEYKNRLYVYP